MIEDPSDDSTDLSKNLSDEANKLLEDLDQIDASQSDAGNHQQRPAQHGQSGDQSNPSLTSLLLYGFAGLTSALVLGVIGLVFVNEQRQAIATREAESAQLEASRLKREQAAKEQAAREQSARDQAAKEQAAREQATREQAAREQAARELAVLEQGVNESALTGLYQAVAIGDYGAWGATWNYDTQQSAEVKADEICRDNNGTNCRAVIWARNACLALAETTDRDGGFGWAWNESRDSARTEALRSCQSSNPSATCRIAHQRCQSD